MYLDPRSDRNPYRSQLSPVRPRKALRGSGISGLKLQRPCPQSCEIKAPRK